MLVKTKGIVIKKTKFSDSEVVVKIYTEEFGVQSFFVRGMKNKKSTIKYAFFQPLTMLNLVINFSKKKSLHSIKEIELWHNYQSVNYDMIKRTILFFVVELLHKCLKEESENKELFNWIHNAPVWLDLNDDSTINFHLVFMMQLSMFMGFFPINESKSDNFFFDLQEGKYCDQTPSHTNYVSGDIAKLVKIVSETKFEDSHNIKMNNSTRKRVLETLIAYYELHLPSMGEFKSLEVLSVVLE